jgi:hypothetical protein
MEVFFTSLGDEVRNIWQTSPANGWSGIGSLGGTILSPPAVSRNGDGRLEVFVIGTDRRMFHRWQVAPNNGWSPNWTRRELGNCTGNVAAIRNGDHRIEVFVLNDIGNLIHMWQNGVNGAGGWGWNTTNLGGATLGGLGVRLAELGTRMAWMFRE